MRNIKFTEDSAAKVAFSKWLESNHIRMRLMSYPAQFKADQTFNKGHAMYDIFGEITIIVDNDIQPWKKGDALIIPENIPHEVINNSDKEAQVIVMDNK